MHFAAHALGFVLFAALGCDSPTAPRVEIGKDFTISQGQVASLADGGLSIAFKSVAEDSRCPTGAQCIWEGDAKVIVAVTRAGKTLEHELHTSGRYERSTDEGTYQIELVKLDPHPVEGRPIAQGDYKATFKVGQRP